MTNVWTLGLATFQTPGARSGLTSHPAHQQRVAGSEQQQASSGSSGRPAAAVEAAGKARTCSSTSVVAYACYWVTRTLRAALDLSWCALTLPGASATLEDEHESFAGVSLRSDRCEARVCTSASQLRGTGAPALLACTEGHCFQLRATVEASVWPEAASTPRLEGRGSHQRGRVSQ